MADPDDTGDYVPALRWTDVTSSNLAAVAHDGGDLFVRFNDGTEGRYLNVPQSVFDDLLQSASKGRFLHAAVKPRYTWVKG